MARWTDLVNHHKWSLEQKKEFWTNILTSGTNLYDLMARSRVPIDIGDYGDLTKYPLTDDKIAELRDINIPEKFADYYEEVGGIEEILHTFSSIFITLVIITAPIVYRKYLLDELKRRHIWPPIEGLEDPNKYPEPRRYFPVNWALAGMPNDRLSVDDLMSFAVREEKISPIGFRIEQIPTYQYSGYGQTIDLELQLLHPDGTPTGDYVFRSISECPNFYDRIPGFDIDEELERRGIDYNEPEAQKIYWDKIYEEVSEKLKETNVAQNPRKFYETYWECQARICYDVAYGQLYQYFKDKWGWAKDQLINCWARCLKVDRRTAEERLKTWLRKLIIEIFETYRKKEEE